ncbi:hypothetical protein N9X12_09080 [Alphaproteobacteria bacterium]|nr:hypothetical protein [Alphaproteobacteria bacterium]
MAVENYYSARIAANSESAPLPEAFLAEITRRGILATAGDAHNLR